MNRTIIRAVLGACVLAAAICLGIGINTPLMSLEKFWWFHNEVSLLSALVDLYSHGEWFLFTIIGTFSLLFPIFKLLALSWQLAELPDWPPWHWLSAAGKWSMLDVFVVAILVTTVKLGALATVTVGNGIYWFACAVLLSLIASAGVSRLFLSQRFHHNDS